MACEALKQFEVEAIEISYDDKYIVFNVTADDIKELTDLGFKIVPYPNYNIHHNKSSTQSKNGTIPGYPSYKLVEKTYEIADSICKALPGFATFTDVGDSWEKTQGIGGYDIKVLRLTNPAIKGPKPKFFVTGSIHAREYATSELNLRFVLYLLENYKKDPDITWMLDYQEFHAMFYANPNGRKHAEKGKMWRKNTNMEYCKSNPNRRGCDLNRNFDYNWSGSNDQCGETFSGASGGSEPETQAVQNYLQKEFADSDFGIYIDLHAFGQYMMNPGSNHAVLEKKFSFFNGYSVVQEPKGMTFSYGYNVVGVASFLFELGTSFFQNCQVFEDKIVPDNIKAFKYAFRVCRAPFKLSLGPDALDVSIKDKVITATIDDTKGSSSTQNISAAEYYIGIPPWEDGAKPIPMTPLDGNFDSKNEKVTANISAHDIKSGNTPVFVRGKDASNNWGPVYAVYSDLINISTHQLKPENIKINTQYSHPLSLPVILKMRLPQSAFVKLNIYDLKGKLIAPITKQVLGKGEHSFLWSKNKGNIPSKGMYLLKLEVDNQVELKKLILAQ